MDRQTLSPRIAPPQDIQRPMSTSLPLFPFAVEVLDDRVYVFRDYSTDDGRLAASEIRSINGISIDHILATMTAAMPGDGNVPTSRRWRIGRGGGFQRLLYPLLGIQSPFHMTLQSPAGKTESFDTAGILQPKLREIATARYPNEQKDRSADFRFEDGGEIAVLTIYGFGGSAGDPKKPLAKYFPDVFRQIHAKGAVKPTIAKLPKARTKALLPCLETLRISSVPTGGRIRRTGSSGSKRGKRSIAS